MIDSRQISTSLADMHLRLNAIRPRPAQEARLPCATAFVRPGEDNAFPSSAGNRLLVYDPVSADLVETVRAGAAIFARAGVTHWFIEIGAGVQAAQVVAVMNDVGARVWPHVRYPVLARTPGDVPAVKTSLEVRRIEAAAARAHATEVDAIWDKPGASAALISAAERPGYEPVLALDGGRAVAMGILIHSGVEAGTAYLASGGTHPDFRNRGGQSAIIAERVRIAKQLGCGMCVSETVLTVETSTSNLLKAGFARVFDWLVLEVGTPAST
jgi:GNAT superfamily N-acetyltransferase